MTRPVWLLALPFVSSVVLSCGDDEPDKFRDKSSFCKEWAVEACTIGIVEECADDKEDCRAGQASACELRVPSNLYNKAGARECIDAVADAYKDNRLTAEERSVVEELTGSCSRVISGDGQEGDTCDNDRDCSSADNLVCIIKAGETDGACHDPQEVTAGDRCDGAADVCAEGTFCDAASERCFTSAEVSDTCSLTSPCEQAAMCWNDAEDRIVEGEEEGTCVEKGGNQDPCASDAECASGICAPNSVCVNEIRIQGDSVFNSCEDFHN